MTGVKLSLRQSEVSDFESVVDYFLKSDKDFLLAMGVEISKLPSKEEWLNVLTSDFYMGNEKKSFFYVTLLLNNEPVGHSNINKIVFSEEAYMHLHLWQKQIRQKGIGFDLLQMTLPHYFDTFKLKKLYCEPSAFNPAQNKALEKLGFYFIKSYDTIPGWINSYQTVNRWCLAVEKI